jgi:transposase
MGQQTRSGSLFYCFRLEDQIPENHLLRQIDRHVDLSFVRERLKGSYSSTGRPSIDPRSIVAIALGGLFVRDYERASLARRSKDEFGLSLVHSLGFGSGNPESFDIFQEPAWTLSSVRSISGSI